MSVDQQIRDSLRVAVHQQSDAHQVHTPSVESVQAVAARQARRSAVLVIFAVVAATLAVVALGGMALSGRPQSQQHVITPPSPTPTSTSHQAVWPRPVALLSPGLRQAWDGGVSVHELVRALSGDVTYDRLTATGQRAFLNSLTQHGQLMVMLDLTSRSCRVRALDIGPHFDGKLLQLPGQPWQTLEQGTCSLREPTHWSKSGDAWTGGRLVVQHDSGIRDVFRVQVGFGGHRPSSFDPYHEELRLWLVRTTNPDPMAALRTKALYTVSGFTPNAV